MNETEQNLPAENPIYGNIADLHEDMLKFLLMFRQKAGREFTFLFNEDEAAWAEGRWFYGNDRWVNVFFLDKKKDDKWFWKNNFQISLNLYGSWNLAICLENDAQLVQNLAYRFEIGADKKHFGYEKDKTKTKLFPSFLSRDKDKKDKLFKTFGDGGVGILNGCIRDSHSQNEYIRRPDIHHFENTLEKINKLRRYTGRLSLSGFEIQKYCGIQKTSMENLPEESRWIFLTGENGFGKTSLLQSIAIGLYGDTEDPIVPKSKETHIKVSYRYKTTLRSIVQTNDTGFEDFFRPVLRFAAYGPSRLDAQSESSDNKAADNTTATYGLFHTNGYMKNIELELKRTFAYEPEKYAVLVKLIQKTAPSIAKIEVADKGKKVFYYEKEAFSDKLYEPVTFGQLASGLRNIINIAGDIFIRLNLPKNTLSEVEDFVEAGKEKNEDSFLTPEELSGIVIIDEIDLHLHPKWQKTLPGVLSAAFPNIQFIASTHSPIPLLGAPEGSVFLKVSRSESSGTTVERLVWLEDEIKNLLPNSILSSEIFDFHEILPASHKKTERIRHDDDALKIKVKNLLQDYLKEITQRGPISFDDFLSREL